MLVCLIDGDCLKGVGGGSGGREWGEGGGREEEGEGRKGRFKCTY